MSRRPRSLVLVGVLALVLAVGAPPSLPVASAAPAIFTTSSPSSGVFVHVRDGLDAAAVVRAHAPDVTVLREYPRISAVFVAGPVASLNRLSAVDGVARVQQDRPLQWLGDTSSWATRVRVVQEFAPGGSAVDGDGVGVAIVDSGVNAAHPDLRNRVARNYTYVCTTPGLIYVPSNTCYGNAQVDMLNGDPIPTFGMVDAGDTNSDANGHGTLVAGVIAGDGTMSTGDYPPGTGPNIKGTFTGVAPGATIYSYGSDGAGISVLYAVEALYHVLVYGNTFSPRVGVVNASFGDPGGAPFDPSDIVNVLVDDLVSNNVTVVFPAGNGGGTGSHDMTNEYCKNPRSGVICVANYDDADTGRRDGALHPTSSRGLATSAGTWPDISAPGTHITSTCMQVVQPPCTGSESRWPPSYGTFTGTSAAAAHVSGVAALLLQVNSSLSPADIEDLLKDTAYKYTPGGLYVTAPGGGTSSFDKGAGLVDAKAALLGAGFPAWTPTAPNNVVIAGGDGGDFAHGAADIVSLDVTQTMGSSGAPGFRYDLELADALDFGPDSTATAVYRLYQTAQGVPHAVDVVAGVSGVAAFPGSPAQSAVRVGNTVSFFVPFDAIAAPGGLTAGEPVYTVRAVAYFGTQARRLVDVAPSGEPAAVAFDVRPMFGRPYMRA